MSTVTIPESVTHIGSRAFLGSGLTSVTNTGSVAAISNDTFLECGKTGRSLHLGWRPPDR